MTHLIHRWVAAGHRAIKSEEKKQKQKSKRARAEDSMMSDPGSDITELNAEEAFLPTLIMLHQQFPNLWIVLEHCTSAAALAAVRACGPSVAVHCTTRTLTTMVILCADRPVARVTAHHLYLTFQHCCDLFTFCKPVLKMPADRDALIKAVCSDDSKFFL